MNAQFKSKRLSSGPSERPIDLKNIYTRNA